MGVISLGPGAMTVDEAVTLAESRERTEATDKADTIAIIGSSYINDPIDIAAAFAKFKLKQTTILNEPTVAENRGGTAWAVERWFDMMAPDSYRLQTINFTGSPSGIRNRARNRRIAKRSSALLIMFAAGTPFSSEFVDAIIAAKAHDCKVYIYRTDTKYK